MAFKQSLQSDKQDEAKAIKNYGQRKKQAPGHMKPMLSHIQSEEKDHHKALSAALQGLKNSK